MDKKFSSIFFDSVRNIPKKSWLTIGSFFILAISLTVTGVVKHHKSMLIQQALTQTQQYIAAPGTAVAITDITNKTAKSVLQDATVDKHEAASIPKTAFQNTIVTVRAKDNLLRIFKRVGLDVKDARKILALNKSAQSLRSLHRGQKIDLVIDQKTKKLQQLTYCINPLNTLTIKNNNGFRAEISHVDPTPHLEYVSVPVHGSIYASAKRSGLSKRLTAQLVGIFKTRFNFAKDVHQGDKFALFYRDYFLNGKKYSEGDIVAAEFMHKNSVFRVVGLTNHGVTNYYTSAGFSLKSPFVRYPLKFQRISSRFTLARFNPVLHIVRAHLGVDLVAPYGTPIKAASDGHIAFLGRDSGYGNKVILQHGKFSTLYAHLSRFGSGLHSGNYVKQGQVIGYVGATGIATGPHLHYEFRVNGVHYDPLKVKLPTGELIAKEYRHQFFALAKQMVTQLAMRDHVELAMK